MAATSQDEFVDLYEILELATDAEADTIRKRINELYLESQQNLDHRNAKKRLQYQQMYEIYLPQARHLLLDVRRREEYDRYLTAYRTGSKVVATEPSPGIAMPETAPQAEEPPLPGMAEVEVDPAVLAAEREDIWAKWKHGLETVADTEDGTPPVPVPLADRAAATQESATEGEVAPETAEASPAAPGAPPRPAVPPFAQRPQATQRPAAPAPRTSGAPGSARPAPPAPRTARPKRTPSIGSGSALAGEPTAEEIEQRKEHERRLEIQRSEITQEAAQLAGLISGAIAAAVIFVIGCIGLFFLINSLKQIPLGMSSGVFSGILLLIILAGSAFGGMRMRDKAENGKEVELSELSHEELLRRFRS